MSNDKKFYCEICGHTVSHNDAKGIVCHEICSNRLKEDIRFFQKVLDAIPDLWSKDASVKLTEMITLRIVELKEKGKIK